MMASMLGFVREQIEELRQRNEENAKKCQVTIASLYLEARMSQMTLQAMSEKLGMATKHMVGVDTSLKGAVRQRDLVKADTPNGNDPQFLGDCVVTTGAPKGRCSAECRNENTDLEHRGGGDRRCCWPGDLSCGEVQQAVLPCRLCHEQVVRERA